jgi:hypothetical protein
MSTTPILNSADPARNPHTLRRLSDQLDTTRTALHDLEHAIRVNLPRLASLVAVVSDPKAAALVADIEADLRSAMAPKER